MHGVRTVQTDSNNLVTCSCYSVLFPHRRPPRTVAESGDEVRSGKPAPDIYLNAAEKLCTEPIDCLAFEDSNNGTTAALAAGMNVIQIPDLAPSNRLACPPTFHICSNLAEGASIIGLSLENTKTTQTV